MTQRHYFDHAATTRMRRSAIDAWVEHADVLNPGGTYASGRRAQSVLAQAREIVAEALGCEPIEVIFTGSGTEADNLAVRGFVNAAVAKGETPRVVTTPIEHPAVRETVQALSRSIGGLVVDYLPVSSSGHVGDLSALNAPATVAAVMWANNETGAIQPIEDVAAQCQTTGTPLHVDAVQVVGHLPVDFSTLGATTLAASAHKFGGPRGVGLLLTKRSPVPAPVLTGGGQQRGIRPGTQDVAGAIATAVALKEAVGEIDEEKQRLTELTARLRQGLEGSVDKLEIYTHSPHLPGHLFVSFPGAEADSLIMLFDSLGIEVAAGSACSSGVNRASHVLEAMGVEEKTSRGAIRFTLGRTTTDEDVDYLLAQAPGVVERARRAGMA
ncbi:cysteine desulfurase family protein [Corynebacterium pyruviciproducens]|uniref:Cysteine desulfurase family protein n=1 Tax=Corynebacterium pyruviciproducens TaxID=598660 RepID=A0AAF1BRC9_9CORY|nr:cysteine desulfurase family protein [Corynebacterium pyruviciproducens]MDH4658041.1 cysteine desulfurase [Corynebacterium pyruviciproducens]MDK6565073.1 cysteine desulfurase family protein [Corynebacterium pyruviciproducens]MDK7213916.1 cysteine desulfurase family protein [Corynebacterium pyruviciproducens]WOT01129.1 cysteine desulfurase family protein [Corynebacterium pyruviciproducens]